MGAGGHWTAPSPRKRSLEYAGLRGEGSTAVPLYPPASHLIARITAIFFNQLGQFSEGHFASAVLVAMMVRTYPGCSRRIRARMVTPISSLISSGGLSICCATAEPSKLVTSSSLDRNGISSSSRLVASAFCKASVNLAERTRAALNSFAKPVLSVRNVRMAATLFYRSIDFSSQ